MATLEQVEKLRERANVTFEQARAALDEANGDMLDALIILERQGKVTGPEISSANTDTEDDRAEQKHAYDEQKARHRARHSEEKERAHEFFKSVGRFLARVFELGNTNYLDAYKNDATVLSCPVTVLVILLIVGFWVVVPLMILGLFFGWKYRFRGVELGRENVNNVMEKAESVAEELKGKFTENGEKPE
jgi:hypothetical protein